MDKIEGVLLVLVLITMLVIFILDAVEDAELEQRIEVLESLVEQE